MERRIVSLRKFLCLLTALILFAAPFQAAAVSAASYRGVIDYSDLGTYAKERTAADWANVSGILPGVAKGTFGPNRYLTRGALLKAIWRMAGKPYSSAVLPFSDTSAMSSSCKKAVAWAYEKGIVVKAKKFYPTYAATRQNCAVYLYRFAKYRGCNMNKAASLGSYSDASSLPSHAKTAFKWCIKAKVVMPGSSSAIKPKASIRRSEGVQMLYNLHKLIPNYTKGLGKPRSWNSLVLREISEVADFGGYYTSGSGGPYSQSTYQGMNAAFKMSGGRAVINIDKARPSFCSSACYMLLLKTISDYNGSSIGSSAWTALRPYTVSGLRYAPQEDGVGCWGRANANGPGMAVLIKELGAGKNIYIGNRSEYSSSTAYWNTWAKAEPGDFLKIFRSDAIGAVERGHMVVFIGSKYATNSSGKRDDIIYYWSSTGSSSRDSRRGYGIASCRASAIYRGVLTKITKPSAFSRASSISPANKNKWLASMLYTKNVTVADLKNHI